MDSYVLGNEVSLIEYLYIIKPSIYKIIFFKERASVERENGLVYAK